MTGLRNQTNTWWCGQEHPRQSKNHCRARVNRTSSRPSRLPSAPVDAMPKAAALPRKAEKLSKLLRGEHKHEQIDCVQRRQRGAEDCRAAKHSYRTIKFNNHWYWDIVHFSVGTTIKAHHPPLRKLTTRVFASIARV